MVLDSMVGIDHNAHLVNRAATRMQHAVAAAMAQPSGSSAEAAGTGRMQQRPRVQVLKGDIAAEDLSPGESSSHKWGSGAHAAQAFFETLLRRVRPERHTSWRCPHAEAWGPLHGIDAALMIEVVEHLDPPVLQCASSCPACHRGTALRITIRFAWRDQRHPACDAVQCRRCEHASLPQRSEMPSRPAPPAGSWARPSWASCGRACGW